VSSEAERRRRNQPNRGARPGSLVQRATHGIPRSLGRWRGGGPLCASAWRLGPEHDAHVLRMPGRELVEAAGPQRLELQGTLLAQATVQHERDWALERRGESHVAPRGTGS
jgi:hypothetical protein